MQYLPGILALLIAAAGWFYMFYSRAASKLAGIESPQVNRRRVRLRQLCGAAMILLAASFYAGFVALEGHKVAAAVGFMIAVFVLMGAITVLGLIDIRMTNKLRGSQRKQDQP